MKTKFWMMTMAAGMMLALSACSSSEGGSSEHELPKPETPISDDDWQTITSDGGIIEKDDITMEFPSGTFTTDSKVAVTEVKQGKTLGEDEASPFYQIVMPVSAKRPITISVKCDEPADNIYLITYITTPSMHLVGTNMSFPVSYEATYSNGEYTATLPAFENGDEEGELFFSVGLAHRARFSSSANLCRGTRTIDGETEGEISWYFDTDTKFEIENAAVLAVTVDKLNGYIHDALKKINSLGFKISNTPKRRIPITLFKETGKNKDLWGEFKQHHFSDTKSWFAIKETMLSKTDAISEMDIKATIYHELLHYFQADYDQRIPFRKATICNGDELMMYECGGKWIEKFVNGGKIPCDDEYKGRVMYFAKSLTNLEEAYADNPYAMGDGSFDIGFARQSHGYAMATLIEYLARFTGDNKIVDLYWTWASNTGGWGFNTNLTTLDCLKTFASNNDIGVFSGAYDLFILDLANAEILPDFNSYSFYTEDKPLRVNGPAKYDGTIYPYGADAKRAAVKISKTELESTPRNLVIKPETEGVYTYVYDYDNNNTLLTKQPIVYGDSLVVSADKLKKNADGDVNCNMIIINTANLWERDKPKEYKVTAEIQSAEDIDVTMLNVNGIRFDTSLTIQEEGRDWTDKAEIGFSEYWSGVDFTVSQSGDRVHINAVRTYRSEELDGSVFDHRDDLSFDILGFSGNFANCRIENLTYSNKHDIDWGGDVEDGYVSRVITEASCSLTDIKVMEANLYPGVQYPGETSKRNMGVFRFGGQYPDAFTIKDITQKDTYYEAPDEKMSVNNSSWVKNPEDNILLVIDFNYSSKQHK